MMGRVFSGQHLSDLADRVIADVPGEVRKEDQSPKTAQDQAQTFACRFSPIDLSVVGDTSVTFLVPPCPITVPEPCRHKGEQDQGVTDQKRIASKSDQEYQEVYNAAKKSFPGAELIIAPAKEQAERKKTREQIAFPQGFSVDFIEG